MRTGKALAGPPCPNHNLTYASGRAENESTARQSAGSIPRAGDFMGEGVEMSGPQHLAEFVEKAAPIATKTAVTSAVATGASTLWTLPEIAYAVGIAGTITATAGALLFQYLNYRLNKTKTEAEIRALNRK